ncbi:hypothetical protein [Candidatus Palauibacter sp.]|uniref:hypothetical protein n=1 Tax=Candidatus Palauibacter sp. TaxID=3101350 RepID=UPI003B52F493
MNNKISWAALLLLALPSSAVAQARERAEPMTENAAARALMDNRLTPERNRALALALELGPRAGPDLRAAVIHAAWAEWRGETNRPEGEAAIEAKGTYAYAVGGLQDPQAIPFLVEVLPNGLFASNALADFGAEAFPAVFEAAADPEGHPYRVDGCLTALRFMLEDGSLSPRQVEQVQEVVRDRLSETQHHFVVKAAVRLALALGDSGLRRIVDQLATDRTAAEALVSPYLADGVTRSRAHQRRIDQVQETAQVFLSGEGDGIGPLRRSFPPE